MTACCRRRTGELPIFEFNVGNPYLIMIESLRGGFPVSDPVGVNAVVMGALRLCLQEGGLEKVVLQVSSRDDKNAETTISARKSPS